MLRAKVAEHTLQKIGRKPIRLNFVHGNLPIGVDNDVKEESKPVNLDRERSDAGKHRPSANVVRVYNEVHVPPIVLP